MLSNRAALLARSLQASLLRQLPDAQVSPIHAGLCTAFERLLSADAAVLPPALCRTYSSTAGPIELAPPAATPTLAPLHAATAGLSRRSAKTDEPQRSSVRRPQLDYRHAAELRATRHPSGAPDGAVGAPQHRWGASTMRPPRGVQDRPRQQRWRPDQAERRDLPRQEMVERQRWRPDQAERGEFPRQETAGGPRWQPGGPPPRGRPGPWSRPPLREEERGPRGAWSNKGPAAGPQFEGRYLPPQMRQSADGLLQRSAGHERPPPPQQPQQAQQMQPETRIMGNPQLYILERAERANAEGTPAALQGFVEDLKELLTRRKHVMHMVQVSSCLHRLGRLVNTVSSKRNPLAHTDGLVDTTPGLLDVLNELSEMAVEMAHELDSRAIPNVLWAMGMIRKNPLDGRLLDVICKRILEMVKEDGGNNFLSSMGCAHVFWAFASLRVNPLDGAVLDAVGEHLMRPEAAGSFNGIDLSNIFWACGILGIKPCSGKMLPALALHVTENVSSMNQQGCSNILWGLAKQDLKVQEMYGMRGQPYFPMIEALVKRSQVMMETDAAPVNFSMILWALGSMNYHPGEVYMKCLLGHLQRTEQIHKFDAQNLCNLMWGLARLAEHPGEPLMAVYRQRQDRILYDSKRSKSETEQALTNTLWAMAVLDELDADVAAEVYRLIDPASSNTFARIQLFQAHLYLFSALPKGAAPQMPLDLFKSCKDSWNQVKMQVRVSSLQWSILNAVRNAGFKVHPEYNDGIFSIDMAVFLPHPDGEPIRVAIEADGVEHYTCNKPLVAGVKQHRPTGRTLLRNKLLRACGWLVVDVPYFEWNALRSSQARTAYLKAAIALEVQSKCQFMAGLQEPAAAA
ncbi:probable RAP domain-containing protein, chloroplastic at C-terminar half [Coccomyxa sp. Obi]|nr:probable RAP domain-containing protein, chloroplastic at C-terminar half [Coccomyxa sp. Obi]